MLFIWLWSCNLQSLFVYRSKNCFKLGWPMKADADFFVQTVEQKPRTEVCRILLKINHVIKNLINNNHEGIK